MYGNAVDTAVTFAIGENGSKMAYFSHSARTAHSAPPEQHVAAGDDRLLFRVTKHLHITRCVTRLFAFLFRSRYSAERRVATTCTRTR